MKIAVLDTGILIHYLKNSPIIPAVENFLYQNSYSSVISVVTKAELLTIAAINGWGTQKINHLENLLASFAYVDIEYNNTELLNAYVSIDAFSRRRGLAPDGSSLQGSARNMGKNDLWIAATARTLKAVLLTTDKDFDHLNNIFLEVKTF